MPRKKNSKARRRKRVAKQKQLNVEIENMLNLITVEKRKAERMLLPDPNTIVDRYLMRFP